MKKHNWCIVGVSVLSAGFAGPSFAQTAPANWTGPYIGAFGGYGFGSQGQHDSGIPVVVSPPPSPTFRRHLRHLLRRHHPPPPPPPPIADGHYDVNGALGGALIGYNIAFSQFANFGLFNQFIIGAEGDIAGSTLSGSSGACGSGTGLHACGGNVFAMADVRARLGLPLGQFMPFIAGGLAVDDIRAYDNLFGTSGTHWEAGWTAGAGIDYKITQQISVRLEYLYQDFARQTFFDIVPGLPERVRTDVNIVRAGIVWNFEPPPPPAPPVVAKY